VIIAFVISLGLQIGQPPSGPSPHELAVVDAYSQTLDGQALDQYVDELRQKLGQRTRYSVLSKDLVRMRLNRPNPLAQVFKQERTKQSRDLQKLDLQLDKARELYLASRFGEAIGVLQQVWQKFDDVPWVVPPSLPLDVLSYLATCELFLGNETAAKNYLSSVLDLSADFVLKPNLFPPNVSALLEKIRKGKRFAAQAFEIRSSEREFEAFLLGHRVVIQSGEVDRLLVPMNHPVLGDEIVLFLKDGFYPETYKLSRLPTEIRWRNMSDQSSSTRGLFGTLGSLTLSPILVRVLKDLQAEYILFFDLEKTSPKRWGIKAQWLQYPEDRRSAIIEQDTNNPVGDQIALIDRLLAQFDSNGDLIIPVPESFGQSASLAYKSPEFYQTWWFWTLVGVGVAGAGAGTYYLMQGNDELRFSVRQGE